MRCWPTRLQEKQQADAALKAKLGTAQEEIAELRKKYERSRGDLKQRTVDVHMLQVCWPVGVAPQTPDGRPVCV